MHGNYIFRRFYMVKYRILKPANARLMDFVRGWWKEQLTVCTLWSGNVGPFRSDLIWTSPGWLKFSTHWNILVGLEGEFWSGDWKILLKVVMYCDWTVSRTTWTVFERQRPKFSNSGLASDGVMSSPWSGGGNVQNLDDSNKIYIYFYNQFMQTMSSFTAKKLRL